ncbi:hypothetical protein [Streptomyces djakartensis]|jgi:hypothetical protein|uniref:hypothetical protein n=1 Tax=Streptomyces djakartensis TaxID=68193 RepID=UPI0034DF9B60
MSDLYAVDLALDLSPTTPDPVLELLRLHLEGDDTGQEDPAEFVPLLAHRGPAWRIGGLLTGELLRAEHHWSLTARQEIHAELLPDLMSLAEMLAHHARTEGVIGQLRWYENDIPELLVARSGALVTMELREADSTSRH